MQTEYLGKQSALPTDPDAFKLECVPNPAPDTYYGARFTIPEFTSLCPVTGQPDFATIIIDYVPRGLLVESKAIKLYLGAFRNIGDFHEAVTNKIADKIADAAEPYFLRVAAFWYPRGGIPIDVLVKRPQFTPLTAVASALSASMLFEDYLLPMPRRDYRGR